MREYIEQNAGEPVDDLLTLAREAQEWAYTPYDEPMEGAAVVATDGDNRVAIPGTLVENGNYTNTRTAAEVAVLNALTQGYGEIEQLAVSRDRARVQPLHHTTHAICDTFLADDTPVTVEAAGDSDTYRYDSLRDNRPARVAPELAADAVHEIALTPELATIDPDDCRDDLVAVARGNMAHAYNPSSNYDVGAALVDAAGTVHVGNNVEPDKPGSDAEVEKRAVAHGEETAILRWRTFSDADPVALAVASRDSGNCCGYCKQWMAEFFPDDLPVYNVSADDVTAFTYGDIDPHPFRLDLDA